VAETRFKRFFYDEGGKKIFRAVLDQSAPPSQIKDEKVYSKLLQFSATDRTAFLMMARNTISSLIFSSMINVEEKNYYFCFANEQWNGAPTKIRLVLASPETLRITSKAKERDIKLIDHPQQARFETLKQMNDPEARHCSIESIKFDLG